MDRINRESVMFFRRGGLGVVPAYAGGSPRRIKESKCLVAEQQGDAVCARHS